MKEEPIEREPSGEILEYVTKKDVIRKSAEAVKPLEDRHKKRIKHALGFYAVISSVVVILLFVLLYRYYEGFCGAYNIPVDIVALDLKRYIPSLISVFGVALYIILYFVYLESDIALNKTAINPIRILYGFLILFILVRSSPLHFYLGSFWSIILSIIVSAVLELTIYFFRKPKKEKKIPKSLFSIRVEDGVFFRLYRNPIVLLLIISTFLIIVAQSFGKWSAEVKKEYQICNLEQEQYAVIIDYDDKVLVQRVEENEGKLKIVIDDYLYVSKIGTHFFLKEYDSVIMEKSHAEEDETSVQDMISSEQPSSNDSSYDLENQSVEGSNKENTSVGTDSENESVD